MIWRESGIFDSQLQLQHLDKPHVKVEADAFWSEQKKNLRNHFANG